MGVKKYSLKILPIFEDDLNEIVECYWVVKKALVL